MRELARDGMHWSVREMAGTQTPGSHDWRCLIFDSETVVRRVWEYPDFWQSLSDDDLWALVASAWRALPAPGRPDPAAPHEVVSLEDRRMATLAAETTARAHSLLAQIALLRDSNESLRRDGRTLLDSCRDSRTGMQDVVERYAARMRADGVTPEQAIVRIKGAVTDGVGAGIVADDADAETVLRDAVTWGIAAYYAA